MKKKHVIICFLVLMLVIFHVNTFKSAASEVSYTREELQDFIVTTGLSYLHNKRFSDYDQKSMDNDATINWRTFNVNPESVNRANFFHIDCSSFVASTYIHSLGYDFSEFYNILSSKYYKFDINSNSFSEYTVKDGVDNFKEAYRLFGKSISTLFYTNIGNSVSSVTAGTEYINQSTNTDNIVVYFYKTTGEETNQSDIKNNLVSMLEPGDIVVYRTRVETTDSATNETDSSIKGHAMLYVGDIFDSEGGFIHSTGYDYVISDSNVTIGDDSFSVRYDGMYKLESNLFLDSSVTEGTITTTKKSVAFTVLRPINKYCTDNSCKIDDNVNSNIFARVDLSGLKTEQYASSYNLSIDADYNITEKNLWSTSKYNSVNIGDTMAYSLYLQNNSQITYCYGSGAYTSQSGCENAGYTWKTSIADSVTYNNLVIESKIPNNVEYVTDSCNYSCSYDQEKRTVTWVIDDSNGLKNGKYRTLRYFVNVVSGNEVVNEGMKITTANNNVLQLDKIVTHVNPTFSKLNISDFVSNITKFKNLVEEGKIVYNSSNSSYKYNLDNVSSVNTSQYGFVKNIYYNTLGIDLSFLSGSNIKNAIFNNDSNSNYAKKTEDEISKLTNETYQKINKMLVKGFYGGRYLWGNDNGDRKARLRIADLEVGDIIVSYYTSSNTIAAGSTMFMYLGTDVNDSSTVIENEKNSYFVRFESANGIKLYTQNTTTSSYTLFNELYSKDLFVVLRPTQLYGTTVNYENSTIDDETMSVEYSTYQHLSSDTSGDEYTLKLDYDEIYSENNIEEFKGAYSLLWFSDETYSNNIKNGDALVTEENHTLYSKWDYTPIVLPTPNLDGYSFKGWYSDSALTTKVADGGASYAVAENTTLYAKWEEIKYSIIYNLNEGTQASGATTSYGITSTVTLPTPTKLGYIFEGWYENSNFNGSVISKINTGTTGNKTYYAKWKLLAEELTELNIDNGYIYIVNNTTINNLGIRSGYSTKTYKNDELKTSGTHGTGDKVEVYKDNVKVGEYTSIVKGDTNGDGSINIADIAKAYQYLKKKISMEEMYEIAGNVANTDGEILINDVAKLYQFIKGKITSLE